LVGSTLSVDGAIPKVQVIVAVAVTFGGIVALRSGCYGVLLTPAKYADAVHGPLFTVV
jgi:hypothetical protein